ncbi:MAG: hypothetical protein KDB90_18505, partial [Planctomycetes bacterium]|nr:hypothetical protein [Planctomycetota bacterium]
MVEFKKGFHISHLDAGRLPLSTRRWQAKAHPWLRTYRIKPGGSCRHLAQLPPGSGRSALAYQFFDDGQGGHVDQTA